jgi:hypothetical protein
MQIFRFGYILLMMFNPHLFALLGMAMRRGFSQLAARGTIAVLDFQVRTRF